MSLWSRPASIVLATAVAAMQGAPAHAQKKVGVPASADKSKTGGSKTGGAMLPGGNSGKPINIEAVKLDYYDKEQKLIYTGDVVATQGDAKLKATVLTIFLTPKKSGESKSAQNSTNQVQRMLMKGPVTILQRDQVGTGDNGVYDKPLNTVVLTGNVTLSQGPNVTKGDKLVYNLKTSQAVVTGRVKSLFIPDNNNGNADKKDQPVADSTTPRP